MSEIPICKYGRVKKSGRRGVAAPSSHTTGRAVRHPAVHQTSGIEIGQPGKSPLLPKGAGHCSIHGAA